MKSRIGQGVVYLQTGNRSGSVECLNLATGAILTRDIFKVVPTTTTTVQISNDLAALDDRYMAKMSSATHDDQSVAKTNNPTFLPVQPPLRDMVILALIPDNPHWPYLTHQIPLQPDKKISSHMTKGVRLQ
jgi:hypothetical protein